MMNMEKVKETIFGAIEYGMDTSEEMCHHAHKLSDCFYVNVEEEPMEGIYIPEDLSDIWWDMEIFTSDEGAEIENFFKAIVEDVNFECKAHTGKKWGR